MMTYQFKIKIKGITKPPVWRRIQISENSSFYDLHIAIQLAFEWYNAHLFQFSPQGYGSYPQISLKMDEEFSMASGEVIDADEAKLSDFFHSEKQRFTYIYDFGDDWFHDILLEKILDKTLLFPLLIAGKGQCPPEDCGGIWAYENLKEVLADPEDPEYEELSEWVDLEEGELWDPNKFDLKEKQDFMLHFYTKTED